jgi:hypothetical protein
MGAQVAVPKDNPHLQIAGDDAMRQTPWSRRQQNGFAKVTSISPLSHDPDEWKPE